MFWGEIILLLSFKIIFCQQVCPGLALDTSHTFFIQLVLCRARARGSLWRTTLLHLRWLFELINAFKMGVPRFYRWLSERYPLINGPITRANAPPIDHFYLDMNGIMHNCARSPENPLGGRSDEDIYWESCRYIDMLVTLIQPKRLLFLAVDGVAPRAKMNQQRARRYRAATALEKVAETNRQRGATRQTLRTESEAGPERVFDSNCITPGTQFMRGLTQALLYYVAVKLESDRSWRDLEVIVSGAEVPGEGEHKIMEYIRKRKENESLPANTRHCIYGLDADLIFLGLVTHEPHFFLLREKIDFQAAFRKVRVEKVEAAKMDRDIRGEFELLSLGILREYLSLEFAYLEKRLPTGVYDLERIINDFVLLAFLVGNDFIPHSPTLEIREGALNSILFLYKELLPRFGGYLTRATGEPRGSDLIDLDRLEILLSKLGLLESYILERRDAVGTRGTALVWSADAREDHSAIWGFANSTTERTSTVAEICQNSLEGEAMHADPFCVTTDADADLTATRVRFVADTQAPSIPTNGDVESEELELEVPLWDQAALAAALIDAADVQKLQQMLPRKRRYYREKLGIDYDHQQEAVRLVCRSYLEAIVWTLEYYLNGVASWRWFYPYHYGPFCSDMVSLQALAQDIRLEPGTPFLPLQQLLAVLPPRSAWCLPEAYAKLMTERLSPLADLYPRDVPVDMEGKRNDWEGVVLLPFMDEDRLLAAIAGVQADDLSTEEDKRNQLGSCILLRYRQQPTTAIPTDNAILGEISSPFPSRMARAVGEQVQAETISLHHERGFEPRLPRGTKPAADKAVRHPSLFVRDITHYFENVAIDIFGMPSKLESCILRISVPQAWHETDAAASLAEAFLSSVAETPTERDRAKVLIPVRIGYPWHCPALLTAIESATERVTWDAAKALVVQRNDGLTFRNTDSSLRQHLLQHAGLHLEPSCLHGRIRRLVEIASGGGVDTASIEESFPMSLIDGPEWKEMDELRQLVGLQVGDTVIYIGRQDAAHARFYGSLARVVAVKGSEPGKKRKHAAAVDATTAVVIRLENASREPSSSMQPLLDKQQAIQYVPLAVVLRLAGLEGILTMRFAGMLMGKLRCRIPKNERFGDLHEVNLGLGLRFKKEMLVVPGYAVYRPSREAPTRVVPGQTRAEGTFLFAADAASRLLRNYHETFPGVLERMDQIVTQRGDGEVILQAVELFGEANWPDMVGRIQEYLKALDSARLPLLPTTSRVLVPSVVEDIQALTKRTLVESRSSSSSDSPQSSNEISFTCRRSDVSLGLSPTDPLSSTPFEEYVLGDRVVYVAHSGAVPFGARGTVVGIHPPTKEVDVVFDQEFIGGSDLQGRCTGCAGKTLDAESTLLNLTRAAHDRHGSRAVSRREPGIKMRPRAAEQRDASQQNLPNKIQHEQGTRRQRDVYRATQALGTDATPRRKNNIDPTESKGATKPSFPMVSLKSDLVASSQNEHIRDIDRKARRARGRAAMAEKDVPPVSQVKQSRQPQERAMPASMSRVAPPEATDHAAVNPSTLESPPCDPSAGISLPGMGHNATTPRHRTQVAEEMSLYLKQLLRIGPQGMPASKEAPHP
jgi:5'-3' exoribonuclease 1